MEKRNGQLEHGQPIGQTKGLICTCDSGVARCQSQHQWRTSNPTIVPTKVTKV